LFIQYHKARSTTKKHKTLYATEPSSFINHQQQKKKETIRKRKSPLNASAEYRHTGANVNYNSSTTPAIENESDTHSLNTKNRIEGVKMKKKEKIERSRVRDL